VVLEKNMATTFQSQLGETLVGAAVIAVAAGFFVYATKSAGTSEAPVGGYKLSAEFDNIEGINIGTDVRLAGIKVGTVVGQALNPESYQARVDLMIQPDILLAEDSSAKISSEGLLGGKFVALEPGGADVKLADGGVINYTQGAVDIWSLISQAMFDKSKSAPAPAPDTPPTP
jgi:phospholipid/cholesterol/gamma-HCH transport system substrate-binding protein